MGMKQYRIDELRPSDYQTLKNHLDHQYGPPEMGGIYWIPLDEDQLSPIQKQHPDCRPFFFAVDLEETAVSCELLVRTRKRIRCDCIQYASEEQRNWLIRLIDTMFEDLDVKT
ncbi:MAG: hypothetical protein ACOZF0_19615 [Thermodesulfobacteriota bacterium]